MNTRDLINYIKSTEKMVLPEKVAAVNQFSKLLRRLPLRWQKKIASGSSGKNNYMGFIVEPYSFFLSYEITDTAQAERLLPEGFRLYPTSMFSGGKKRPAVVIGAFNVHTGVFWGSRVEVYLIAENIRTGLLSWVIVDYQTNTNSYDPGQGFRGATTSHSVVTTSFRGDVIIDVQSAENGSRLAVNADIKTGKMKPLDQRLWIEGNLSVDYGGDLGDGSDATFGLIFDPDEMIEALEIPLESVELQANTLCSGYISERPYEAACFPFAQHFVTTSMPETIGISNVLELGKAAENFGAAKSRTA